MVDLELVPSIDSKMLRLSAYQSPASIQKTRIIGTACETTLSQNLVKPVDWNIDLAEPLIAAKLIAQLGE